MDGLLTAIKSVQRDAGPSLVAVGTNNARKDEPAAKEPKKSAAAVKTEVEERPPVNPKAKKPKAAPPSPVSDHSETPDLSADDIKPAKLPTAKARPARSRKRISYVEDAE